MEFDNIWSKSVIDSETLEKCQMAKKEKNSCSRSSNRVLRSIFKSLFSSIKLHTSSITLNVVWVFFFPVQIQYTRQHKWQRKACREEKLK